MCAPSLLQLSADFEGGIEGGKRTLQHERDLAPPESPQFAVAQLQKIITFELNRALHLDSLAIQQSEDRHGKCAFAGSALPD